MSDLASIVSADSIEQVKPWYDRIISELSWKLQQETPEYLPWNISQLRGVSWVTIRNDGSTALTAVRLTIPRATLVDIQRVGQPASSSDARKVIELGTLQPGEIVSLIAWSDMSPRLYARDIRLTHDKGLGVVTVRVPSSPIAQWLDQNWSFVVLLMLMLLPLAALIALLWTDSSSRMAEKHDTQDADADPQ